MAEAAANGDAAGDRQQAATTAAGSNLADRGSPQAELSDADNVPKAVESDPTQRYTRVRRSSAAGEPVNAVVGLAAAMSGMARPSQT